MKRLMLTLSILFALQAFAESKSCIAYLSLGNKDELISDTDQYIAFIAELLKQRALPDHFLTSLAEGKITNPFENKLDDSDHIIYAPMMQDYMKVELDLKQIQAWAQQELNKQKRTAEEKAEKKKNAKSATIKMTFHRVEGGDFLLDGKYPYKIDSYELMSTSVTQWMWFHLKGLMGASKFVDLWPSENLGFNEKSVPSNLDHPVENITFFEADEFIKKLNALSRSQDPKVQADLRKIIFDHQIGDTYDFPTFLQMQFARNNRGLNSHEWFLSQSHEVMLGLDWILENSKNQTHAVAEKNPYAIDDGLFYDLNGNVFSWTKTTYLEVVELLKAPVVPIDTYKNFYSIQGASFINSGVDFAKTALNHLESNDKRGYLGLRLVRHREVKK